MQWITIISGILEEVLSLAATATSGQISNIINIVEKFIETAVSAAPSLIAPLQNIINALSGNGAVTTEQLQTLQDQSARLDAGLDTAAADDKLS